MADGEVTFWMAIDSFEFAITRESLSLREPGLTTAIIAAQLQLLSDETQFRNHPQAQRSFK